VGFADLVLSSASGYRCTVGVDVVTAVEIARPRGQVAAYSSDPTNATTWYDNIKRVDWKTSPPVRVGSKIAFVARFLGRELAYTYEVTVLDPGERLVMRTDEGPFQMETIYIWEETPGGGTRMTLRNRGEPAGFSKLAAPFMVRAMRRANRKDLARLRRVLEARSN
jgi:Polyketide cyclase / dehydrase and lipid transport